MLRYLLISTLGDAAIACIIRIRILNTSLNHRPICFNHICSSHATPGKTNRLISSIHSMTCISHLQHTTNWSNQELKNCIYVKPAAHREIKVFRLKSTTTAFITLQWRLGWLPFLFKLPPDVVFLPNNHIHQRIVCRFQRFPYLYTSKQGSRENQVTE